MHLLIEVLIFLLVFHYAVMNPEATVVEFTFDALPLGHSGLLMTWKPNVTTQSEVNSENEYTFMFKEYIIGEKNYEDSKLDDHRGHMVVEENKDFNETRYDGCKSSERQYKIHSLNESTPYEIIIQQYYGFNPEKNGSVYKIREQFLKQYAVKIKTNLKSTKIPAKPHFEYDFKNIRIKWYPCGRERICQSDQESGTHFGVRVREPYNTWKWIEIEEQEFYLDHMKLWLWWGRVYEIVVFSVNGERKTDSDIQEIFLKPSIPTVQFMNLISLPDSSVLISWKPPKLCEDKLFLINQKINVCQYVIIRFNQSEAHADMEAPILFPGDDVEFLEKHSHSIGDAMYEQIRITKLKFQLLYYFIILPGGKMGPGLESRRKFKLKVYNNDLPIATPDFNYKFREESGWCFFFFQWLPCGQSFNCENSRPGSNYSFQFNPEPNYTRHREKYGYYDGIFDMDKKYYVSLTSSIGNCFSKPTIKYFQGCNEIKDYTFKNSDEL